MTSVKPLSKHRQDHNACPFLALCFEFAHWTNIHKNKSKKESCINITIHHQIKHSQKQKENTTEAKTWPNATAKTWSNAPLEGPFPTGVFALILLLEDPYGPVIEISGTLNPKQWGTFMRYLFSNLVGLRPFAQGGSLGGSAKAMQDSSVGFDDMTCTWRESLRTAEAHAEVDVQPSDCRSASARRTDF